jgi:hypothetical protein
MQEPGRRCTDVQPAEILCGYWDTQRQVLESKGISKQAQRVSVEMSGRRTGGHLTRGVDT